MLQVGPPTLPPTAEGTTKDPECPKYSGSRLCDTPFYLSDDRPTIPAAEDTTKEHKCSEYSRTWCDTPYLGNDCPDSADTEKTENVDLLTDNSGNNLKSGGSDGLGNANSNLAGTDTSSSHVDGEASLSPQLPDPPWCCPPLPPMVARSPDGCETITL